MTQEINPTDVESGSIAETGAELPMEVEPDQWYRIAAIDGPEPWSFSHYVLGAELLTNVERMPTGYTNPFVYHYGDGFIVDPKWRRREGCVYWGNIVSVSRDDIPAEESEIRAAEKEVFS